MSRRFLIAACSLILIAALVGGGIGRSRRFHWRAAANANNTYALADEIEKDYTNALGEISGNYAGDIDYDKATQAAIQGMLSTLDPHSVYFPYNEFKKLKEDQDSSFYGIGVSIVQHRDGVYVQSVVEGAPAARLGLRYGDRIVEVDGNDARSLSSEQVSKKVRGARGEPVRLKVERADSEVPLYFTLVRDAVPLPSIRNAYMVRPGTGYVGLTGGFQTTSDKELRESLDKLRGQGMRQLILDLRNNPGGLLNQAIDVASEFLPRGLVIVSVKGRTEYSDPIVYKSSGTEPEDIPLVVLINRGSASASEIVAGAIQDHGRGLIVGETSFGKGLVQKVFPLPFNTGLTLTTARYYTPYGRSLQRDYSSGSLYDYYTRHEEPQPGSTPNTRDPNSPFSQASPTPLLQTGPSVKTAAGRVFFGGGGITPDIEVRQLTFTPLRNRIVEAAFQFTRILAAGKISGMESYKVAEVQYRKNPRLTDYPMTEKLLEAFRTWVKGDTESELSMVQLDENLDFVKLRLREEIITAAFSQDAGMRVLVDSDPQVLRALEALPDAKRLAESVRQGATRG
jgi:carboxyl-terminal processing protease